MAPRGSGLLWHGTGDFKDIYVRLGIGSRDELLERFDADAAELA